MKIRSTAGCLVACVLGFFLLVTTTAAVDGETPTELQGITEVSSELWASDAIQYVKGHDLLEGCSSEAFISETGLLGVDVVTVLFHIAEETEPNIITNYQAKFPDASGPELYVGWAENAGLIGQKENDFFQPDALMTREQIASLFYRYAKYYVCWENPAQRESNQGLYTFSDREEISEDASGAMDWAVSVGILVGTGNGTILPNITATRTQFAVMTARFHQYVLKLNGIVGLSIRYPSFQQERIQPGRDFYVIGDFSGSTSIPENACLEVRLEDSDLVDQRTVSTSVKNNTNLYLDYPGLSITEGKDYFTECMMPDLVYDPTVPDSWKDTWNKACYSDSNFTATVFGGGYTEYVNPVDQFGRQLSELPKGVYMLVVSLYEDETKAEVLGQSAARIVISSLPNKVLSRFWPQEHLDLVAADAGKNNYVLLYDPFPGYWLSSAVNLNIDKPFHASIPSKWQYMDAKEYEGGNIQLYLYNISDSCTSWATELGKLQFDKQLFRVRSHYYDTGEPMLPHYNRQGNFMDMIGFQCTAFTRVDYPTGPSRDGYLKMSDLNDMESVVLSDTHNVVPAEVGDTLSIYGVTEPIQDADVKDNGDSTYAVDNRLFICNLYAEYDGKSEFQGMRSTGLTREFSPSSLSTSVLEFKFDIKITDEMRGKTVIIRYDMFDLEGNAFGMGEKAITVNVAG